MAVKQWVKNMVEEIMQPSLEVGKIVRHPDGRKVKIIGGSFWGEHGVSNFWKWREVRKNGKLARKVECGYGW